MNTRILQAFVAATAALLLAAAPGQAQEQPFEISLDGGLVYNIVSDFNGFEQDNVTEFTLPFQQARLSVYVAPQLAVDGGVYFDYRSDGDFSISRLGLTPGLSYYFAPFTAGENRTYVTGLLSFDRIGDDDGDSSSQFGFGGRIGTKLPVGEAGFVRLEGGFTHLLENEDDFRPAVNRIEVAIGLGAVIG